VDDLPERFNHIDGHFMGRYKLPKQSIQDWVPMDSGRSKGDSGSPCSIGSPASVSALNCAGPTVTEYDKNNAGPRRHSRSGSDSVENRALK
jgi:hypothetical protein